MALVRKSGTTNVNVAAVKRRSGTTTWVTAATVKRRSGTTWVTVWQDIAFSLPTTVSATAPKSGLGATAILTLASSGLYSGTRSGTWVTPTTQATGLDVYVTYSGTAPTGTINAWVPMTTGRQYSLSCDAGESLSCTLTFQFRKTGTTPVIATATVAMSVRGTP